MRSAIFRRAPCSLVGMAAMIAGCLCFLTVLTNRERAKTVMGGHSALS